MHRFVVMLISMLLLFPIPLLAEQNTLVFTRAFADNDYGHFQVNVLKAVIEITPEYGETLVVPHPYPMPQGRQVVSLLKGEADVMWSVTSSEREAALIPIRLPLMKGFAGYRALVIKQGAQVNFPRHLSTEELKQRTFVQGNDWPDLHVLQANGFNAAGEDWSLWFSSMFTMVEKGIVDAFPRNIIEVNPDLTRHASKHIVLEKHHLLFYPNYEFFFVRPGAVELSDRIHLGLSRLIENGRLETLFSQFDRHKMGALILNDENRVTHHLENKTIPYELDYARWDLEQDKAIIALTRHR